MSIGRQTDKEVVVHTMEYYSAIKKNAFELVLMRWMKLKPIIHSEVSKAAGYRNTECCILMRWMKLKPIIQSEVSQKENSNTVY